MDNLIEAGEKILGLKGKKNDDVFDRLSSRYTTVVLIIFAAANTLFQLTDDPITCWFPAHFHESHEKFANNYCWVKNTYYLPYDESIPKEEEDHRRQMVTYYQYIPFILLTQALLFKLPGILWDSLNSKAGLDADDIMVSAGKLNHSSMEERRENILQILTQQLDRFLSVRGKLDLYSERYDSTEKTSKRKRCMQGCCRCRNKRFGAYLTVLFLIIKLLYIGNVFFQIFILNHVLSMRYSRYGIEVMTGMISDTEWQDTPYVAFPRVTMCDIMIRRLGNIQRYTLQCTLPLNLFNEKMYVFLWFWFFFVLILTIVGFFQWFIRVLARRDKRTFLMNHLGTMKRVHPTNFNENLQLDEFIDDYLKQDGVFLLRLISHNTNNLTTREIIASLWDIFLEKRDERNQTFPLRNLSLFNKKSSDNMNDNSADNISDIVDEKAPLKHELNHRTKPSYV